MKILLVTPNFHQPRGNTVTVQRIADGLEKSGLETEIISITEDNNLSTLPDADLVHGFNAYRFYKFMQQLEEKPANYIITLTGTDFNHNLYDKETRNDVITCLKKASAVQVFNQEAKQVIQKEVPEVSNKVHIISQGIGHFKRKDFHETKEENTFLFVLPAGIRKVKNVPVAIEYLEELHAQNPAVRLWLIGPILEEAEGEKVLNLVEQNKTWVKYIGQVPYEEMGVVYHQADCILNTSISEGQSSAVLDAMGNGIPVLVANNQGNASIVTHYQTGMLYENRNQFLDYAREIMNNIELRQSLTKNARDYIAAHHSTRYETEALLKLYHRVLHS